MIKTAILVDGGFYRKRAKNLWGIKTPKERAEELHAYCLKHIENNDNTDCYLYRIFYYDCEPLEKKMFHPYLKKQFDLSKSEICGWMKDFLEELKFKRKFALRKGKLSENQAKYIISNKSFKALCKGEKDFSKLVENDFELSVDQKGVDMKIGLDIATLAFKKQVDQIILISGDSDFVPAAKYARREGIDFVLDNMGSYIKEDLSEHIDGTISFFKDKNIIDNNPLKA